MSVTAVLQSSTRKCLMLHFLQLRALSGAEAVNALRPFYLAVHPDFFGQHPREREVNENSLKRLNGYLETLQKSGSRYIEPTKLTFYMRDTKDSSSTQTESLSSGFRSVSFTLRTSDVLSTVMEVLGSCSLSVEHMQELRGSDQTKGPLKGVVPFYRPIKWNKSYYAFTGFRDPEQELEQARRVEPVLKVWLKNNQPKAMKKHNASLPRREELSRLKRELCDRFDLLDIRWQRSWAVAHKCSQLQSLTRLAQQSPDALISLQGHTIVFADQSGMNSSGHVLLGTMDVHHQWTKLFMQLPSFRGLQHQTDCLKERISFLLGGAQVVHMERLGPARPIAEHYRVLSTFHKKLLSQRLHLHPRSLHGLTLVLENDRSTPSLHQMGHFIIPSTCDPTHLQHFLQSHAPEARHLTLQTNRLLTEEGAALKACLQTMSLKSLSKEPSISSSQMIQCCSRLQEQQPPLMQGLHVSVSHFYSVLQDGELCIPWDWHS
ncbi:T-cell activation inhibitor, mitochondrial [Oryzias melastigma]|uniref:T-cell activation inhibitor, mitochondrial n=1 Tax=Oryzias melastigma TaxID=30732 RepID=A0A834FQV4_ORYME|nr:T-cell activation inhibitor, mitochondrial [Oryzias melastigma]